jgi:hypothetical protein
MKGDIDDEDGGFRGIFSRLISQHGSSHRPAGFGPV